MENFLKYFKYQSSVSSDTIDSRSSAKGLSALWIKWYTFRNASSIYIKLLQVQW